MTVTDRTLAACPLRPGPWPPAPRTCVWCAAPLAGRQRRWCGPECSRTFTINHQWGSARQAAVKRDGGRCTACGIDPEEERARLWAWRRFLDVVTHRPEPAVTPWDRNRESHTEWLARREVAQAPLRPWRQVEAMVADRLAAIRLEVNHRTPIRGRHGEFGCHHHLDGLETLCRSCHLDVTAQQFGHKRPAAPAPTLFGGAA